MEWRLTRFPVLPSTNDLALDWMRSGRATAGEVLIAEEQLAGRGRPGRSWRAGRGALLMTAVLPFLPERVGWTALAAGIAVARAARDLGAPAGVKWPNDVVLAHRKLAGILAESTAPELIAVGIGMNVSNPLPDDPEVAERAVRLADVVPDVTVEQALDAVLARLSEAWALLLSPDWRRLKETWEELDTTRGRRLRWNARGITGTAAGVDADGALLLRTDAGEIVRAVVGEVDFQESRGAAP